MSFATSSLLMVVVCYYYGQKYYPVPYKVVRGIVYLLVGGALIYASSLVEIGNLWLAVPFHLMLLVLFLVLLLVVERGSLPGRLGRSAKRLK